MQLLDRLDGLIFSGGGDIDPALYHSPGHPTVYLVDPERDTFELALAKAALMIDIPILGICRGMQVLNVATGGDLVLHVPDRYGDRLLHRLDHPRRPIEHTVQIEAGSRLAALVSAEDIDVVSWHHQAVQAIASDWQVVAHAADGLIEAMEHKQHPWMIAVQWHPELSPNDSVHQRLFQAFVTAATKPQHYQRS
jgi:putative glutamine amidotransferase